MHVSDTIWDGPADVVFTGGAVYTVDPARTWAQAVAVKDGRIVTVGTDGSVADLIGPKTQVHDLGDRMLLPGFQDAHVHPPSGGLEMLQCNLKWRTPAKATSASWPTTRASIPTSSGSGAEGGRWTRSPAGPRPRTSWTISSPTGRCTCRTVTATGPG